MRLTRFFAGVLLAVVLWAVARARQGPEQAWVHPASNRPGPVRIMRFYASSGIIVPGQHAQLCYGVENARKIRISPAVDSAYVSRSHCVEIYPEHTTHYTLQAEGFDGTTAMRSITLDVEDRRSIAGPVVNYASGPLVDAIHHTI